MQCRLRGEMAWSVGADNVLVPTRVGDGGMGGGGLKAHHDKNGKNKKDEKTS